ncbi:MAG: transglutaminase domain-containing protein [Anaerolineales bacterium]|nr:transglutaminase domain-containing protein [Anaerolineales bacterium]
MRATNYYAQQGALSTPGNYVHLFAGLPKEIGELCKILQGLMVHVFWAERYGLKLPPARQAEVQLRWTAPRLARILELNPAPLAEIRPLEEKVVGNCRDFTLLLVSILRSQGIPARARCGFGKYFLPDHFEDHWAAEYWHAGQERWVLVDAQLDPFQCSEMKVTFDPVDVPRDQFVVAGLGWQMCRSGQEDPEKFGIFEMHGLWFIRGNLVRDLAALNKVELLPWDCWGLIEGQDSELSLDDCTLLDRAASLTAGDRPDLAAIQALYNSGPRLKVGDTIKSYVNNEVERIVLTGAG